MITNINIVHHCNNIAMGVYKYTNICRIANGCILKWFAWLLYLQLKIHKGYRLQLKLSDHHWQYSIILSGADIGRMRKKNTKKQHWYILWTSIHFRRRARKYLHRGLWKQELEQYLSNSCSILIIGLVRPSGLARPRDPPPRSEFDSART